MKPLIQNYQKEINDLLNKFNYVFLDNIFPNPVKFFYPSARTEDPFLLDNYTVLINFWREVLGEKEGKVFIPWRIYLKTFQSHRKLKRTISYYKRENGGLPEKLVQPIKRYQTNHFSLLRESRKNIFGETQLLNHFIKSIKKVTKKYSLKREYKKDDFSSEALAASAFYQSYQEKKPSLILTYDHDLEKIVSRYLQMNPFLQDNPVIVNYPPYIGITRVLGKELAS